MSRIRSNILIAILVPLAMIVIAILVVLSPIALQVIDSHSRENWPELSNIGQTYGAVSALLAALALVGVAVSVLMQNRELRHDRWEAGRSRHFDIIRMALDDPLYRQIFSIPGPQTPDAEARQVGYINMLLEYWKMMWEFGDWSEVQLRACFRDVLSTEPGHSYWTKYGDGRARLTKTRRERVFEQVAAEVYRDLPSPMPHGNKSVDRKIRLHLGRLRPGLALGVAAAFATAVTCRKLKAQA